MMPICLRIWRLNSRANPHPWFSIRQLPRSRRNRISGNAGEPADPYADPGDSGGVGKNLMKRPPRERSKAQYPPAQEEWTPGTQSLHPKAKAAAKPNQRYVRRSFGFKRLDGLPLVPGEKIYKSVGDAFVSCGRVKEEKL